jgi:hypothetical protein
LTIDDVVIGDSVRFAGAPYPEFELPASTTFSFWHDRVSVNLNVNYMHRMTQLNLGTRELLVNLYANPKATLGQQATALAAAACDMTNPLLSNYCPRGSLDGLVQKVNTFRFQSLSIGWHVPPALQRRLRLPIRSVALQGDNIGLWTNYHGKDPNVSRSLIGDRLYDTGQAPAARKWMFNVSWGN